MTNGVPNILCHQDAHKLGLASNHGDVYNWFNKFGKTIDNVRQDVAALMKGEEEVTQEQFNEMMEKYLSEKSALPASSWAQGTLDWAVSEGILSGGTNGELMARKFITREECVALIQRIYNKLKK